MKSSETRLNVLTHSLPTCTLSLCRDRARPPHVVYRTSCTHQSCAEDVPCSLSAMPFRLECLILFLSFKSCFPAHAGAPTCPCLCLLTSFFSLLFSLSCSCPHSCTFLSLCKHARCGKKQVRAIERERDRDGNKERGCVWGGS